MVCARLPASVGRSGPVGALRVHVVDGGEGDVGSLGRALDRLPPAREAVEHAEDAGDDEPLGANPLDRRDRRAAGRDDVLYDEAAFAGLERRTLDPPLEPVLLALLAHE